MFLSLAVVFAVMLGVNSLAVENVGAAAIKGTADACVNESAFFGLKPWYSGLTVTESDGRCGIGEPDDIPLFVWTIVLNILVDISVLVGYVAIVMFAWGGYLYMFSRGMPERAEKGKKTLIAAAVGLLISILASVIMNTIVTILTTMS